MIKQYEKYKSSKIEWLEKIPCHWDSISIKYLANGGNTLFIDGNWIESDIITESGIRYITSGNIGPGFYKEQGNGFVSEETFVNNNFLEVFPGDLVISRLNEPIGRACIIPDLGNRIVTCVDNVILRPKTPFDIHYLKFLMNTKEYSNVTSLISRGATMKRISRSLLGQIKIPVPIGEEQTQIARFLDHQTAIIDEIIQRKEKQTELLKEKRQSIINEEVTKGLNPNAKMKDSGLQWLGEIPESWKITKSKFITKLITDGAHISPDTSSEDFPFISTVDLNRGEIDWNNCLKTTKANYEYLVRTGCKPIINDVLYSKDGTIGKTTVIDKEKEFVVASSLIIIRPKTNIVNPFYLEYLLRSSFVNYQIDRLLSGVALKRISLEKFSNLQLIIPPIKVQEQILADLQSSNLMFLNSLDLIRSQIEKLKEYRQSLISEAITGKIDVRDWQPIN